MKRICLFVTNGPQIAIALFLLAGCGKSGSEQAHAAERSESQPTAPSSVPKPAVVELSKAEPIQKEKMPTDLAAAYASAAEACAPYGKAMPYERAKIFSSALPLIQQLANLNEQYQQQNPRTEDASLLLRLDHRFSELWLRKEIQAAFHSTPNKVDSQTTSLNKYTEKDPGGLTEREAPDAGTDAPIGVDRIGPDGVIKAGGAVGEAAAEAARAMHLDGVMTHEVERLLKAAIAKGDDWQQTLELQVSDSLETRAAKLAVRSAFGDLLGKIVAFKGSYFLGVQPTGRGAEVWEFKQPITLGVKRQEPDAKMRLNTGVQLIALLEYNPNYQGLFRRYANGWWGTWKDFPKLGAIRITKANNWTVELSPTEERPHFWRITTKELELVLARSDTTKIIGQAEAAMTDDSVTEEDGGTLLEAYGALGNVQEAHKCAGLLFRHESLTAPVAKQAAAGLANLLSLENPAIGADFFEAKLFDFYQSYKEFPENGEMIQLKVPKQGTDKHPYGREQPTGTVKELMNAYRALLKSEPENLDAQFDLALLFMLGERETRRDALDCLEAAAKSSGPSPESGRNLRKLITDSPSFFLLRAEHGQSEDTFNGILKSLGSSSVQYGRKFSKAVQYYNSGY